MMIAAHNQVGTSSVGAFENSVVVRIGLDDLERDLRFNNFSNAHHKL